MASFDSRTQLLEVEIGLLKDTVWRLTGRVYVLESFIKKEFGQVLGASIALYSTPEDTEESKKRLFKQKRERSKRNITEPDTARDHDTSKRKKVEESKHDCVTNSSRRSLRSRPDDVNYQESSCDEIDGDNPLQDSDWQSLDGDYNVIVPKNEVDIDLDDDSSVDEFVGSIKSKETPSASNLTEKDLTPSGTAIQSQSKEIQQSVTNLEVDEDFRSRIPQYFTKYLRKFRLHDLFPTDKKYEQLKTLVRLPKGQLLEGVCGTKKRRIQKKFAVKEINGEDVLVFRPSGKRVMKQSEFLSSMKTFHDDQGHMGRDATHKALSEVYACAPRDLVCGFIKNCEVCITRRAGKSKVSDVNESVTAAEVKDGS